MKPLYSLPFTLMLLVSACFSASAASDENTAWMVTLKDEQGGHGVNFIHVLTDDEVFVYEPKADGERVLLHQIKLDNDGRSVLRQSLNRVPIDELKESYHPDRPDTISAAVSFRFEIPNREAVETTMWSGARMSSLHQLIDTVNHFLPHDCRIRGHR